MQGTNLSSACLKCLQEHFSRSHHEEDGFDQLVGEEKEDDDGKGIKCLKNAI